MPTRPDDAAERPGARRVRARDRGAAAPRAAAFTGAATTVDAREPLVAAVVELRPGQVLEVGCGWGELAELIARETGAEVTAVDLSPRMVALASCASSWAAGRRCPRSRGRTARACSAATSRASISMSPFVGNLPAVVGEPFAARRAVSIFVADKGG